MVTLEHLWQYVLTGVAAVVWFLRLEAKANAAHARLDGMEEQRHDDLKAAAASRSEMMDLIKEMRGDIKTLLRENRG